MSPRRLIEGAAFEPDTVRLLTKAYEAAVERVGGDQPVLVLETIARQIIDVASTGERDLQRIVEYATRGIGPLASAG